ERGLLAELYLHRLVELDPAVLARGLGLVHREVRPTQQPAQLARDALQAGDADRGADRDDRVTRADRNLQRVDELVSQQPRLLSTGAQAVEQHDEFVAAQPHAAILRRAAGADLFGGRDEHRIADLVTVEIVDGLELVEVDQQQRDVLLPADKQL